MDASWFEPIRAYCERTDASFLAEPLNAATNGAFLIAAGAAVRRERAGSRRDSAVLALAGLVAVIGVGSFLFHTLANRWSMLADVIPIGMFIYLYFLLALVRFLGVPILAAVAGTLIFAGFSLGLAPALDALSGRSTLALTNGSIGYLPAILALLGVGAAALARQAAAPARRAAGGALIAVAGLFALSLTLRTVDGAVCPSLPSGTHFLWHLLNAGVLYGLLAVALRFRERAA